MRWIAFFLCMGAAFCGIGKASARTSSETLKSDLRSQYASLKEVLKPILEARREDLKPRLDGKIFDFACSGNRTFYDQLFDLDAWKDTEIELRALLKLAQDAVLLRLDLQQIAPARIWQADFETYERQELQDIVETLSRGGFKLSEFGVVSGSDEFESRHVRREKELYQSLANALNSYRRSPKFIFGPGCEGDGEIAVKIATLPAGAQVHFIPRFFYDLCKKQNIDPEDLGNCNRWREAIDNQLTEVIGNYRYIVHWPDGTVRRGVLSFGAHDEGKTITLSKLN